MTGGKGMVSAAFSKSGRVALVATTASGRGARTVHPGSRTTQLRRLYPRRTAVGRGLVRAHARSARIFEVRGGKVRCVAVTKQRSIARRGLLRRYLRAAGVRPHD